MSNYFSANFDQILDGLLFGLGVLAVYLGAVFTGALIRSLGGAGSKGLTVAGRYVTGWVYYLRGDDRDIVNVTLNIIVDNHLKFDTLVADRRTWLVWPNAYRQRLIRLASLRTTEDNPVILFPDDAPLPKSWGGRFRRRCDDMLQDMLATVKIVKDGKTRRVRLQRESDYKADLRPADQHHQREMQQRQLDRSCARPGDDRAPLCHRPDLRAAARPPRAPSARHGHPGGHAAEPAAGLPEGGRRGTQDPLPNAPVDRTAVRKKSRAFRGCQGVAAEASGTIGCRGARSDRRGRAAVTGAAGHLSRRSYFITRTHSGQATVTSGLSHCDSRP